METQSDGSLGPLELQRQIDSCCQKFEAEWKQERVPKLEDYVTRVAPAHRSVLLRELVALELAYRRNEQGESLTDSEICELHPDLVPYVAEQLIILRKRQATQLNNGVATPGHGPSTAEDGPPANRTSMSSKSRNLHIRCPHCSSPIEILSDTEFESVVCRTCGSTFSLIDSVHHTRQAPTLHKINRFELVGRIGMGGFGTVWKARDTELDRTVAIKIPRKGQLGPEEERQFFREARSAAQLRHPNIVPVHEVGRDGDMIFIVSDLIRGEALSDWMSHAKPNSRDIAHVIALVADALHHAHQNGVIHRDLKPANILIDDSGKPHVTDFGLAKRAIGEVTMTKEGQVIGTPAYMSPEQAGGEGHWVDCRTDIYSMGAILFHLITGYLPFIGTAEAQIYRRTLDDAPDPRTLNPRLPRDLCTICLKCLERNPVGRYASAKELAEDLSRYLQHRPILARPISRLERIVRLAKRHPARATAVGLTIFLAIAGPISAGVILRQQAALQLRLAENDNLIQRYRSDVQRAGGQIEQLQSKLDVWEGQSNPWKFWPPERDLPPRREMIRSVLRTSAAALTTALRESQYDRATTARGYLSLALLADAADKSNEACTYYKLAVRELEILRAGNRNSVQLNRASAQCYTALARLTHDTDIELSKKSLRKARVILESIATTHNTDALYHIDWLEAEMSSALQANVDSRAVHLDRVKELNGMQKKLWPTEPGALYRFACYLTLTEPILDGLSNTEATASSSAAPNEN